MPLSLFNILLSLLRDETSGIKREKQELLPHYMQVVLGHAITANVGVNV
jgi:hypothetical protein